MTPASPRPAKRSILWNLVKVLLAVGLLVYVLSKTDAASLVRSGTTLSLSWLVISAALYVLLTLLKALQYYVLMRNRLTYPQVLNVVVWQNAVSNFFLAGAGILTYVTMARLEHDMKVGRSVSIFLLTKIGDLIAIWLALGVSSYGVWSSVQSIRAAILILLAGIGLAVLGFGLTLLFKERFISLIERFFDLTGLSRLAVVRNGMSHLRDFAGMDRKRVLLTFALLLLYSFIYQAVTCLWTYANLRIFHLQMEIMPVVFVTMLLQLVSYFPIYVFGGLGITETTALYFWSFFNVPQSPLASALLGIRAVFYLFNLIPLIYLPLYSAFVKPHEQAHTGQ